MASMQATAGELLDAGLWDDYCEAEGIDPWCLNEGGEASRETIFTINTSDIMRRLAAYEPPKPKPVLVEGDEVYGLWHVVHGELGLFRGWSDAATAAEIDAEERNDKPPADWLKCATGLWNAGMYTIAAEKVMSVKEEA